MVRRDGRWSGPRLTLTSATKPACSIAPWPGERVIQYLTALALVGGSTFAILQIVHEFYDTELTIARIDQLAELSLKYGITTTLSPLFHNEAFPDMVPRVLGRVEVR